MTAPPDVIKLVVVPVAFPDACEFVDLWHRHHARPQGHKFSLGVVDESRYLRGVAIVGRPVARHDDDGVSLEVTRLATDATHNACSMLYGAAWRAGRAMGYRRIITFTHADESGASLRAVGWRLVARLKPRTGWSTPRRPRHDRGTDGVERCRWEALR